VSARATEMNVKVPAIALSLLLLVTHAAAAPSAEDIVKAADAVRNPGRPFSVTNALTEYRDGQETGSSVLRVYAKRDAAGGQFHSLIQFVAPARDAQKLMLYNDRDLWFFDPSSKASVRLSPQQRLLGQASNGDAVTVNLWNDYSPRLVAEEDITDGEHKPRHTYKLALAARTSSATYDHIDLWVDTDDSQPIKALFFAASGEMLKTAYYRRMQMQLGAMRPTETVIIDGLNPRWVTVMRYSGYAVRDIPEIWMQRDYLPRFHPE
jgi:outer membrane lipoprotein-sorting protein